MQRLGVAIWGSGGFAREVAWLAEASAALGHAQQVRCFVDDDVSRRGAVVNGVPVVGLDEASERYPEACWLVGLGDPSRRRRAVEEVEARGFRFATLVHPGVVRSPWVEIGAGSVIFPGSTLTTNVEIGEHVQVNPGCSIGHDARIGSCSTLAPGARVSGWVHIGERVYLGAGAVVINGTWREPLVIGDDVTIGAAACVTGSVANATTVTGIPARPVGSSR
jgi:sugar O-acyltransferase (sialic acid O-acetyltransferase NeuD family)